MKITDIIYANTGVILNLSGQTSDPEAQALIATLMALVANSDGDISRDETVRMVDMLHDRYQLDADEAVGMISQAVKDLGSKPDINSLMVKINDELSLRNKEDLMSMVLHIISADDEKDAREMKLLSALISGLKIPDNIMEKAYEQYFHDRKNRS